LHGCAGLWLVWGRCTAVGLRSEGLNSLGLVGEWKCACAVLNVPTVATLLTGADCDPETSEETCFEKCLRNFVSISIDFG
jgi:hypothetical protein